MRIAWNVNSLKARLAHVLDYCQTGHTDCLMLQELKLSDENFPISLYRYRLEQCLSWPENL